MEMRAGKHNYHENQNEYTERKKQIAKRKHKEKMKNKGIKNDYFFFKKKRKRDNWAKLKELVFQNIGEERNQKKKKGKKKWSKFLTEKIQKNAEKKNKRINKKTP